MLPKETKVRRRKILVVSSDPRNIQRVSNVIRKLPAGVSLITPVDACDALLQIGLTLPDVVFLEARLPMIRGREIVNAIRRNRRTAKTRILATSNDPEELDELNHLGVDKTMAAPYSTSQLRAELEHLIADDQMLEMTA